LQRINSRLRQRSQALERELGSRIEVGVESEKKKRRKENKRENNKNETISTISTTTTTIDTEALAAPMPRRPGAVAPQRARGRCRAEPSLMRHLFTSLP